VEKVEGEVGSGVEDGVEGEVERGGTSVAPAVSLGRLADGRPVASHLHAREVPSRWQRQVK